MKNDNQYEFKIVPQKEIFYSEDSSFGIYSFNTIDNVPYCKKVDSVFEDEKIKTSKLIGNMQQLSIGSEYNIIAEPYFEEKYKCWQFKPITITSIIPKTQEQQKMFLQTLVTPNQSLAILEKYPNIIEDVIEGRIS